MNGLETSIITVASVGGLGWVLKYWVTGVDKKLNDLAKDITHIKLKCRLCKEGE